MAMLKMRVTMVSASLWLLLLLFVSAAMTTWSEEVDINGDRGDVRLLSDLEGPQGKRSRRTLPDKLIIGYANWNECDDKLIKAVQQGVNVLIWFSINLIANATTGAPAVSGGPNRECVAKIIQQIAELKLPTIHLISIGGWNSPHPDTSNPTDTVYAAWKAWNDGLFDGFDWDIEGNDDVSSPYNHFTLECLDLMGKMSQLAKRDGFIVSMAPAESYMDVTTSAFDLDLNHTYPEWESLQPTFAYHGHNAYTYMLHVYGTTREGGTSKFQTDTFDFVMVQLYEGYSHAEYNATVLHQSSSEYIIKFVQRISDGWTVDFSTIHMVSAQVSIPCTKLVVGLANGWAGDGKFLLIYPDEVSFLYCLRVSLH
jgi:hypothetical protein